MKKTVLSTKWDPCFDKLTTNGKFSRFFPPCAFAVSLSKGERNVFAQRLRLLFFSIASLGISVLIAPSPVGFGAQHNPNASVRVDADDIGGTVASNAHGPEAGVWVIVETTALPTKFAKIVVTDDQGSYVIPDLPKATYGLVDSPKVKAMPGKIVNLRARLAPGDAVAAEYYPAVYWYSMLKIPEKNEFPLGNVKSQTEWLKPTAASRATSSGTKRRARFRKNSGSSNPPQRRGSDALRRAKP